VTDGGTTSGWADAGVGCAGTVMTPEPGCNSGWDGTPTARWAAVPRHNDRPAPTTMAAPSAATTASASTAYQPVEGIDLRMCTGFSPRCCKTQCIRSITPRVQVGKETLTALTSAVMADWLVWLIAAGALAAAEVLTLTLVLGMLSVAALAGALIAGVGAPAPFQVAVFAGGAVLLLGVVRPVARRHRHMPVAIRTGTDALIGKRGTAVTEITARGGRVRIGGEVWTARTYDDSHVIAAGSSVDICQIDGATAVVLPLELS
jgi:membrane protein implicated in regulation of membrane protease activity